MLTKIIVTCCECLRSIANMNNLVTNLVKLQKMNSDIYRLCHIGYTKQ